MTQVLDMFKFANILHSIVLQETEQVAIDHFLKNTSLSFINLYQQCNTLSNELVVAVALKHVQYLQYQIKTTTDKGQKIISTVTYIVCT